MSNQDDPLLSHEYDGIREYDNPIPAWWTWIWAGSMFFSLLYFVHYEMGSGESVQEAYVAEVQAFNKQEAERLLAMGEVTEATILALMKDQTSVAAGEAKFQVVCTSCHGKKGEGNIGPNLTDAYWLNCNGTLMGIRQVVMKGVVEKGMAAWEKQMAPDELLKVVAFVGTLRGKNLPGKPPQGDKVDLEPESSAALMPR